MLGLPDIPNYKFISPKAQAPIPDLLTRIRSGRLCEIGEETLGLAAYWDWSPRWAFKDWGLGFAL